MCPEVAFHEDLHVLTCRLLFHISFGIIVSLICERTSIAQAIQARAPLSPTTFNNDIGLSPLEGSGQSLRRAPGVYLTDTGGLGKLQTLSIRGSKANDVAVTMEGIRLNSLSDGSFDFGNFSSFGLENARVSRGGYSPASSSSPSGEVAFHLPRESLYRSTLGYGSYNNILVGQETPFAHLSIEQSENDFSYSERGRSGVRAHNASQRINLRAWKRKPNHQIWTQILYSDEELPGGIFFPTPNAQSQTLRPTLAYQANLGNLEWWLWGNYQELRYDEPLPGIHSVNRALNLGQKLQYRFSLLEHVSIETSLESSQDKFYSLEEYIHTGTNDRIQSPLRETLSLSTTAFANITDSILLNPRARFEYVSDLNEDVVSVHPGVGTKINISKEFEVIGNLNFISRVPTFLEKYARVGTIAVPNPDLKRQRSFQGDLGYKIHELGSGSWQANFTQAFFAERIMNLIQSLPDTKGVYQAQNRGTAVTFGLENEVSFRSWNCFAMNLRYTLQRSSLQDRQRMYQPTHLLFLEPQLHHQLLESFSIPIYARSSVKTPGSPIGAQWDVGLKVASEPHHHFPISLKLEASNLLGWNRSELLDYPMANEPSVKFSASYLF